MHTMRLPAWFIKRTRLREECSIIVCKNGKRPTFLERKEGIAFPPGVDNASSDLLVGRDLSVARCLGGPVDQSDCGSSTNPLKD